MVRVLVRNWNINGPMYSVWQLENSSKCIVIGKIKGRGTAQTASKYKVVFTYLLTHEEKGRVVGEKKRKTTKKKKKLSKEEVPSRLVSCLFFENERIKQHKKEKLVVNSQQLHCTSLVQKIHNFSAYILSFLVLSYK